MTITEKQILLAIYSLYQILPLPIKKLMDESLAEDTPKQTPQFSWRGFHQVQAKGKDA